MLPPIKIKHLRLPKGYPKKIDTLGDHLRAARLTRGQYLKHVAELIGVTMESVLNWEQNCTSPAIVHYPKIMEYLGYCPMPPDSRNTLLGARTKLHRIHRGLSINQAAVQIGVDPTSLARWERQDHDPAPKYQQLLNGFINNFGA